MSFDAGFTIPGYQIESLIGQGAFARVYLAVQPQYARRVAVKVLDANLTDERLRSQFERECAATGGLAGHPNILIVLDAGFTSSGKPYLTGSHCEEGSLAERVARDGPMSVTDVLRIGVKLAGALDTAHRAGLVHRDMKPENVLLSGFGEPMLADWGIATITSRLSTKVTMAAMTPNHAAPEVLEGNPSSASSDIYSLGSTLYALLAGRPPFTMDAGNNILTLLVKAASDPVPPIPRADLPVGLFDALVHAMSKRPEHRPESAAAFGHELQQVQYQMGLPYTELITRSPGQGTGPIAATDVAAARQPIAGESPADGTVIRPASGRRSGSSDPSPAGPLSDDPTSVDPPNADAPAFAWGSGGSGGSGGKDTPRPVVIDPTSTVMHDRHAPVIERPALPVAESTRRGKRGLVVAVVLVLLVVGGVGSAALVNRSSGNTTGVAAGDPTATVSTIRGGNGVGSGGATGSAPAGGNPVDSSSPGALSTSTGGPSTSGGGVTSSTAGGSTGPKAPRAVSVDRTTEGLQVQWEDDNGGRYPSVYEVLNPAGKLVSKVSAVSAGTRTAVITETLDGPLTVTEEYCVAVGTIASTGKPVWSAARCTDGSEIPVP